MQKEILTSIYYKNSGTLTSSEVKEKASELLKTMNIKNTEEVLDKIKNFENQLKIFTYREVDELETLFDGFEFLSKKGNLSVNDLAAEIRSWMRQYFNDKKIDLKDNYRTIKFNLNDFMLRVKQKSSKLFKWRVQEDKKELSNGVKTYKILKELRNKVMNMDSCEILYLYTIVKYSVYNDYEHLVA